MAEKGVVVLQRVNLVDLISFIKTKNGQYQATTLSKFEEILGKSSPEYQELRKVYLDSSNNFIRSVIKVIFGDIEVK